MQSEPLVYIIILNWNSFSESAECIERCKRLKYSNFRILIVDNGSHDDSDQRLAAAFPGIEQLQTGDNLGYAAGNNIGIRYALGKGSACVWILNPDVSVAEDTLSVMMGVLGENPSIGICGPRVVHGKPPSAFSFDGLSVDSNRGYQWRYNIVDQNAKATQRAPLEVDCVSGCSMLIRNDLLRSIGLFREDFFLYYEDVELSFRARDHGWGTVVCAEAVVKHDQDVQVMKQPTGFRVERSRVVFARIRKNCTLKGLITNRSMDVFTATLKQGRLVKALAVLVEISLGTVCGLVKPRRPLPEC